MNQNVYPLLLAALSTVACSNSAPVASSGEGGAGGNPSTAGAGGAPNAQGGQPAMGGGGNANVGGAAAGGTAGSPGATGNAGTGAAGAGGVAGGAGTSGSAGAAGSANACSGLLCEDFEQGMIDPTKWDVKEGAGGTAVVQTTKVAHGKYALQVHGLASGPDDYALIVSKNAPAPLNGAHFGRANFFITPKPTSLHIQMVFAGKNGTGTATGPAPLPKLRYMEVASINGGWQAGFDLLDISPLVEEVAYAPGSPQVPSAVWTCLEWQFTDAPDTVNFWIDGKAIGTFDDQHVSYPSGHTPGTPLYNGSSSGLIGGFELFGFGFHDWHPSKAFDLYYDDIVLDTKRVNCLP